MIRILLPTPDRLAVDIVEELCKAQGVNYEIHCQCLDGTYYYDLWTDAPLTPAPVAA